MQVTETKAEGLKREFKIVVPADDIERRVSGRLDELARTARLPGFRPGKVPLSLLRKRYGPSLMGEVLEQTVNESTQSTMSERGLRPVMQPKIEITAFDAGKDLEYTLAVELMPEITPVDLATIQIERTLVAADEKRVDNVLEQLAKSQGATKPISEERPCQNGDVVAIDFVGRKDGQEFPGGKAEGYELELGSGSFIPGFESQLVGAKAGETRQINITFPADYGAADLAGKEVVFDVTIKDIRGREPASIDDELAKKVGMDDLEALKKAIRDEQEREIRGVGRLRMKRQVLDKLAELHEFETPLGLVEAEFQGIWQQIQRQKEAAAKGEVQPAVLDAEDAGKSDDELQKEYRAIAARRVKLGLLLTEIGRLNNVTVTEEDMSRAITAEARKYQGREKEAFAFLSKSEEARNSLRAPIYEEKVVDFILEMAKITDRTVSLEEFAEEERLAHDHEHHGHHHHDHDHDHDHHGHDHDHHGHDHDHHGHDHDHHDHDHHHHDHDHDHGDHAHAGEEKAKSKPKAKAKPKAKPKSKPA